MWYTVGARLCVSAARKENDDAETRSIILQTLGGRRQLRRKRLHRNAENLIGTVCRKQLQESKGKKVYGYLKPEVKRTVDRIFELLASNESIQKMYDLWCEMEQQKHDVYSSAKITPPALIENPQFKSVKNMIIRAVLDMQTETLLSEIEVPTETDDVFSPENFTWNPDGAFETEVEPSEPTIEDVIDRLTVLANQGKAFASYKLGKMYLFGADGIERNVELAMQWLTKSAEDGNEYAQQFLDNMEQRENDAFASTIFGLFVNLSRMIEDDYNKSHKKLQSKIDSKLQHMIRKHKQELGIRDDHGMTMQ